MLKQKRQLENGTLPAYVAAVKYLERRCEKRKRIAEANYEERKERIDRKRSEEEKELVESFELEKKNYKNKMIGKLQHKLMALETVKKESNNWKIVSSFEKFDDLIQRHVEKVVDLEHKSPSKRKRRKVTRS